MKIANLLFSLVFALMLALPPIFTDPHGGMKSQQENRMLAVRPPLSSLFDSPGGYARKIDEWLSDNIGFRTCMIRLHQKVEDLGKIGGFIKYANGRNIYLVGREGHHYYAGPEGKSVTKFQGEPLLDDGELHGLAYGLSEVKRFLDERNIGFLVMLCADKETIYPEFYPESFTPGPEPVPLDVVTARLREMTNADVFNVRESLLAEKGKHQLYHRTNDVGHYNEIGAFFAYRELMRHVNARMPGIKAFTVDDIDIKYGENDIPEVSLKPKRKSRRLDPGFFDKVEVSRPFSWENAAFGNEDASLPTIMFLRDSYTGEGFFLTRYVPEHFGKTILIHFSNMRHFREYIDAYSPDLVVFETAELNLESFADIVIRHLAIGEKQQ